MRAVFKHIPNGVFAEILALDAHSTDGTVEFLREHGVNVIAQRAPGRVNAMIEGVQHSRGEFLVFLSPDGNENPKDIAEIVKLLEHYDLVLTSRFRKGGVSDDADDLLHLRRVISIFIARLVSFVWRVSVTDATNGLRGVRKSLWQRALITNGYHSAELQLVIQAAKLKARIAEIPTCEGSRIGHVRYASTMGMAQSLTRVFLSELVGRNPPRQAS